MINAMTTLDERFKKKFLMKDSDCTWDMYPDSEEVLTFLKSELKRDRQELAEKVKEQRRQTRLDVLNSKRTVPTMLEVYDEILALLNSGTETDFTSKEEKV